jgi:hypothetical protein
VTPRKPSDASTQRPADRLHSQRHHLLAHHASHDDSPIRQISCEHIPAVDYGAGHKYSIFENNVACARRIREEWSKALTAAGQY